MMEKDMGAISGSREPDPASGSGPSGFDPARKWRRDALPFDNRPTRQFVWLSGERRHSGMCWRRDHWGLAYIRPDGLGYREEDIARLEAEGDMDAGTGEVYGWLPACTPAYFDMDVDEPCKVNAIATEARRAETPESGSVHEGAGPQDIAQETVPSSDMGKGE